MKIVKIYILNKNTDDHVCVYFFTPIENEKVLNQDQRQTCSEF